MTHIDLQASELSARFLSVHESQTVFRLLLEALSRPGEIKYLPSQLVQRIPPVEIPLLALLGYDTPFCLVGADSSREQLIARATSGRVVPHEAAAYVGVCDATSALLPMGFQLGTSMRPDFAAQIAIQVSGVLTTATQSDAMFSISGPGVETVNYVACDGAIPGECDFMFRRNWSAPRGVDMWVIGIDGSFFGLPRTSTVDSGTATNKGVL
jgi:alpha-D-ribose 1-methylphosphonate 5-triphosphate synthase subunit PhnH